MFRGLPEYEDAHHPLTLSPFHCFTTMQSESHVANLSSTASGVVGDSCTGSERSGQVVDHSPSASGVVGSGSTGPKSFAVLPAHKVHIDGFSTDSFGHILDEPMALDNHNRLCRYHDNGIRSGYGDEKAFKEHSRRTYEGLTFLHSLFSNLF